jgi:hypothetical protein
LQLHADLKAGPGGNAVAHSTECGDAGGPYLNQGANEYRPRGPHMHSAGGGRQKLRGSGWAEGRDRVEHFYPCGADKVPSFQHLGCIHLTALALEQVGLNRRQLGSVANNQVLKCFSIDVHNAAYRFIKKASRRQSLGRTKAHKL